MQVHYHVSAPFIGGAERQLEYLIKYARRLDPTFAPTMTIETEALRQWAIRQKVPVTVVRDRKSLYLALERISPDIIQFYTSAMTYRAIMLLRKKPKVIEVIHNKNHFGGDPSTYGKDRTDITVCVSPDAHRFIVTDFPNLRTVIIPNGVDPDRFNPRGRKLQATPVLGFAGRLCTDKGIETILTVARALPDIAFELVGQDFGGYGARNQLCNVSIYNPTDDVESFYRRWWGFISASPHESFGLAIAEAMACGCPPVMLDCGGITHWIEDGVHGYVDETVDDLIESCVDLVMRNANRFDPAALNFSAEKMARDYLDLYTMPIEIAAPSPGRIKKAISAVVAERAAAPVPASLAKVFAPVKAGAKFPGGALGVTPAGWYGVVRALSGCCDFFAEPSQAAAMIKKHRPKWVVLGCYQKRWREICVAAHEAGARVVGTWHASHVLNEFDPINREWMAELFDAYKAGDIDFLATPHEGLAKSWTSLGMATAWFPNVIETELEPVQKLDWAEGPHIGILGSAQTWKNMECQIVAAGLVEGSVIHVQELKYPEVVKRLGLLPRIKVHPKTLTDKEYYELLGGMTVNMCVSLSEVYSYLTAESFLMKTPVLTGSITPLLFSLDESDDLHTAQFEDPDMLAYKLRPLTRGGEWSFLRKHMVELNAQYRFQCDITIARWDRE